MPWTVNSEIYPLWARSTGNACSSGINWIFNVLVSLTFLHTAEYLTYYGKRVLFPTLFLDMLSFVIERLYCYISVMCSCSPKSLEMHVGTGERSCPVPSSTAYSPSGLYSSTHLPSPNVSQLSPLEISTTWLCFLQKHNREW